jgi:hypothetical protein
MTLQRAEHLVSLTLSQLAVVLVVLSQLWFAFENPRLFARTALDQPVLLEVQQHRPDRYVTGTLSTGEAAMVRLARREAGASIVTVYPSQDRLRPWLTEGQIKAMQPFFTLGGVTFSWRLFLAAAILVGWLWLWRCSCRRAGWQPVLREMALWSGRGFAVIALLAAGQVWLRP